MNRLEFRRRYLLPYMVLFFVMIPCLGPAQDEIPEAVQQELQRQGMTVEQARSQARELGIDLSRPEQAADRARQLGVPEAKIREMLRAIREGEMAAEPGGAGETEEPGESEELAATGTDSAGVAAGRKDSVATSTPAVAQKAGLSYFGYDFFRNIPDAFRPSQTGPVGEAYIIGPGDELRLVVWGGADFQYDLKVDREGRIYVPNVGQYMVAGKFMNNLREEMKHWLSRNYAGLTTDPPSIFMDLTVTRLRPIRIYVLGEVRRPGGYLINSNSTVFNALYSMGGPLTRGSLRNIRVIRGLSAATITVTVDLYNLLLKGYDERDVLLRENDRVFVPPRGKTVAIRGEVRRPAIYELRPGETFADLLEYSGGLLPEAYTRRFQIRRIIPFEQRRDPSVARKVLDVSLQQVLDGRETVALEDGDQVDILSILDLYQNAVAISGAVYQPGRYEISDTVRTVRDLILQADSLMPDAYPDKADLIRLNKDGTERLISLDLGKVFAGDPLNDIPLLPMDSVRVYSEMELAAGRRVRISGKVRDPGSYALRDSMTVYDLLFRGGGLVDDEFRKEVYLERADLFRRTPDGKSEQVIPFNLERALEQRGMAAELLAPGDEIRIYPREVEELAVERFVSVSGAVKYPGRYRYQDNMALRDLIIRAGGFAEGADMEKAEVNRVYSGEGSGESGSKSVTYVVPIGRELNPEYGIASADTAGVTGRFAAFRLIHRDRVYIRTNPEYRPRQTVLVMGEVYYPGEYALEQENELLSEIIRRAGGLRPTAYPAGGRIRRQGAQLITRMDRAILGQKKADVILAPGDEIMIPPRPNTVAVRGNVANEGLVKFEPGRRVSFYLERVGGIGEQTRDIFLTQADGATLKLDRWFLLPDRNPVVDDGAGILVTRAPEKEPVEFDLGKTITQTASVISTFLTIIVLANRI